MSEQQRCRNADSISCLALLVVGTILAACSSGEQPCEPECSPGFVCVRGRCVEACNPPCAADERCTLERTCVANVDGRVLAEPSVLGGVQIHALLRPGRLCDGSRLLRCHEPERDEPGFPSSTCRLTIDVEIDATRGSSGAVRTVGDAAVAEAISETKNRRGWCHRRIVCGRHPRGPHVN